MKNLMETVQARAGRPALLLGVLLAAVPAFGASPLAVNLGSAANFSVLAKTGIQAGSGTQVVGNIGVAPAAATYMTGFGLVEDFSGRFSTSSLIEDGMAYASDYSLPTPTEMTKAIGDMQAAYTDAAGRAPGATELGAGNISGMTLVAGVYRWSSGLLINTDVTLSGSPTDVWIFQVAQTLTLANGIHVNLIGGAQASNIYWQVAMGSSLGTGSVFNGNILDQTAIVVNTGAVMNGKALAQTAVTVIGSSIRSTTPVAGIGISHGPPRRPTPTKAW